MSSRREPLGAITGRFWAAQIADEDEVDSEEEKRGSEYADAGKSASREEERGARTPLDYFCRIPSPCMDRSFAESQSSSFKNQWRQKKDQRYVVSSLLCSDSSVASDRATTGIGHGCSPRSAFEGLKLPVLEPSCVPMENPIVAAEWTMVKRRSRHLSSSSSPTPTNARFGTSRSNSNHVIFGDDWHRPRTPLLSPKLGSLGHLGQVEKARSGLGISKNQAALGVQKFLGFTWRQRAACAPKTYAAKSIVGGPMANHGGGVGGMLRGGANDGNGGGFRGRA
jgi:hypothetical protein